MSASNGNGQKKASEGTGLSGIWDEIGMTQEAFQALPPERQAGLAEKVLETRRALEKTKQAESNNKWGALEMPAFILAGLTGTALLVAAAGVAEGAEPEGQPEPSGLTADGCVEERFNERAAQLNNALGPNGVESMTLIYDQEDLHKLVTECEETTGTPSTKYKNMQSFEFPLTSANAGEDYNNGMTEADRCVNDSLNEVIDRFLEIDSLIEPNLRPTKYTIGGLETIKDHCKDTTGSELSDYRDYTGSTRVEQGVTIEIK